MTNRIDHAVVILFNVYRGPDPTGKYLTKTHDKHGNPNRAFIRQRFPMFLDATMRSLVVQSSRNFFVVFMYEENSDFTGTALETFKKEAEEYLDVRVEFAPIPPIDFRTRQGYENGFWARRPSEEDAIRRASEGRPWLYVTYLDGDDFLLDAYIEATQKTQCADAVQAITFLHGYAYDCRDRRIREFDRGMCPPFFTLRYRQERYLAGERYNGGAGRHLHVPESLRSVSVPQRLFAQHIHEYNDSTAFNMPGGGRVLTKHETTTVMKKMGLPMPG